jgi:hypothetical protein
LPIDGEGGRGNRDKGLVEVDLPYLVACECVVSDDGLPAMAEAKVSGRKPAEGVDGKGGSAPFSSGGNLGVEGRA